MSTRSLPLIILIFTSRLLLKQVKYENAIITRKQSEETYYKERILDTLHSAVNSSSFGIVEYRADFHTAMASRTV